MLWVLLHGCRASKLPPIRIEEGDPCIRLGPLSKNWEDFPEEFQIFFPGKARNAFVRILFGHFVEIGGIKEDQVRFFMSIDRPSKVIRVPLIRLDLRANLGTVGQVERPAFSTKGHAGVRDNAAPCHGIENKVSFPRKIKDRVGDQLGRDLPGPVVTKTLINVIERPMIPGSQSPVQCLKAFLVAFSFKGNGPDEGLGAAMLFSYLVTGMSFLQRFLLIE